MADPPSTRSASSQSGDAAPIRFGTSGWRGVFGQEFTPARLRVALHAVATWLAESPFRRESGEVIVAHDTRREADRMAEASLEILAAYGLEPVLAAGVAPTPVAARAVVRRGALGAVVFTASHNPPEYAGLKILGHWGGSIDPQASRRIEALCDALARDPDAELATGVRANARSGAFAREDLTRAYVSELLEQLDVTALAAARSTVVYDAMHGAGAGVLDRVLREAGAEVQVRRQHPDAHFGGGAPDPSPERLADLGREVRDGAGCCLGLATDGDADRFGAIDNDGHMLTATEGIALLIDHLARNGRLSRGVALSIATGSLVERVASAHGLRVSRHPIGFKHLSAELVSGAADAAGDESGGFALGGFHRDKDGILAGCLLAEIVAQTGAPLRERLAALERTHGRSICERRAHDLEPGDPSASTALDRLRADPPTEIDGSAVAAVRLDDGLHLALRDGFLMLRASGTEPVLRVYAEAPDRARLERRLAAGAALLRSAGARMDESTWDR